MVIDSDEGFPILEHLNINSRQDPIFTALVRGIDKQVFCCIYVISTSS